MISVTEAKNSVISEACSVKKKKVSLSLPEVNGKIITQALKSKCYSPPFNQSAMDGYAIYTDEKKTGQQKLLVSGEIKAGDKANQILKSGCAIRIFTGARIPKGANAVIQQELVTVHTNGHYITFNTDDCVKHSNVRLKGSQFEKGETLLPPNYQMNAAGIAIAAMAGHNTLQVFSNVRASVLVTGNELVMPGKSLTEGQIYESNSFMLAALLSGSGVVTKKIKQVNDNAAALKKTIALLLNESDVVLISGGISVGKYDLVKDVLTSLGVKTIFHKVKQKPGKPLYFGKKGKKYIFGLPGNPAASMTCFYEYVLPFIEIIAGKQNTGKEQMHKILANDYTKKPGLTHFLKGKYENNSVHVLPDQESYKLTSFAAANCIIVVPEEVSYLKKGESVLCHLI